MRKEKKNLVPVYFFFLWSFLIFSCANPLIENYLQAKTVRFESNGGSFVDDQTIYKGEKIKKPSNPVKSGNTFEGWYRDNESFADLWDFSMVPDSDLTLYAKWEWEFSHGISLSPSHRLDFGSVSLGYTAQTPQTVTVTNLGSEEIDFLTIVLSGPDAADFTLSKNSINNLAVYGNDSFTVVPNDNLGAGVYSAFITVDDGDEITATIGVIFSVGITNHTVTFNLNYFNGGTYDTQSVSDGGLITTPLDPSRSADVYLHMGPVPVPSGFVFNGWFTESTLNNLWQFSSQRVYNDITLYAGWSGAIDVSAETGSSEFERALSYTKTYAGVSRDFTLIVNSATINAGPQLIDAANFDLTILGAGGTDKIIQYNGAANGTLFNINSASSKLTLGSNITLNGISNGTNSLVTISNGTLNMKAGSKITGHTNTSTMSYGAVYLNGLAAKLIMEGGEISGNNFSAGMVNFPMAGVVLMGGELTMSGGKITGNTNIDFTLQEDLYVGTGTVFTLSGSAEIGSLTLNASGVTNSASVNINSAFTGSVDEIHL